jgi:hypothetical protein
MLGQEAGITVFLTSLQHIDLSITLLSTRGGKLEPHIQLRTESVGKPNAVAPAPVVMRMPRRWRGRSIRLKIAAEDDRGYVFSTTLSCQRAQRKIIGRVSARIVSGGSGPFSGKLTPI